MVEFSPWGSDNFMKISSDFVIIGAMSFCDTMDFILPKLTTKYQDKLRKGSMEILTSFFNAHYSHKEWSR